MRKIPIFLRGVAHFAASLFLSLLKMCTRALFLFGLVGTAFFSVLFFQHPELNNDTLAVSVVIVIGSFWIWSRVLFWVMHKSGRYKQKPEIEEKTATGKAVAFFTVLLVLFFGPSLLLAGFSFRLLEMTASSQVAFITFKAVAEIDGAIMIIGILAAMINGTNAIRVDRGTVDRVENGFTSHHFEYFSGLLRQALR